jgi:hypothetical protein
MLPVASAVFQQEAAEGSFRYAHTRFRAWAAEIAMYRCVGGKLFGVGCGHLKPGGRGRHDCCMVHLAGWGVGSLLVGRIANSAVKIHTLDIQCVLFDNTV